MKNKVLLLYTALSIFPVPAMAGSIEPRIVGEPAAINTLTITEDGKTLTPVDNQRWTFNVNASDKTFNRVRVVATFKAPTASDQTRYEPFDARFMVHYKWNGLQDGELLLPAVKHAHSNEDLLNFVNRTPSPSRPTQYMQVNQQAKSVWISLASITENQSMINENHIKVAYWLASTASELVSLAMIEPDEAAHESLAALKYAQANKPQYLKRNRIDPKQIAAIERIFANDYSILAKKVIQELEKDQRDGAEDTCKRVAEMATFFRKQDVDTMERYDRLFNNSLKINSLMLICSDHSAQQGLDDNTRKQLEENLRAAEKSIESNIRPAGRSLEIERAIRDARGTLGLK